MHSGVPGIQCGLSGHQAGLLSPLALIMYYHIAIPILHMHAEGQKLRCSGRSDPHQESMSTILLRLACEEVLYNQQQADTMENLLHRINLAKIVVLESSLLCADPHVTLVERIRDRLTGRILLLLESRWRASPTFCR